MMKIADLKNGIGFRVKHIAAQMLMTPDALRNLLKLLGHETDAKANAQLTYDQVEAVAQNYIRGILTFEKKIRARVHKGKMSKQDYGRLFFMFFEDQSPEGTLFDNFDNWRLDTAKMENFLCRLFLSPRVRKDKGSRFFRGALRNMRVGLKKPLLDHKTLLFSKIPPALFFSYPGEDDDHAQIHQKVGFGMVKLFFMLEAFVIQLKQYKSYLIHEKTTFDKGNIRLQFAS
ncbi:MAG TPA: hypothetical protein VHA56_00300 [Mucilaginibacter sp.]|nr:hypothetical protein [Mucilaginibacter sp.]